LEDFVVSRLCNISLLCGLCSIILWGCNSGCVSTVADSPEETGSNTTGIPEISGPGAIDSPEEPNPIDWDDCGGQVGDHPCDFTFIDQNNNDWSLYDNYGTVMLLDFSTMWCYYCKVAAGHVQQMQDQYGPEGFLWVSVLVDNSAGDPPSLVEIQSWASTYGITSAPILAGDRSIIDTTAEDGYPLTSWPTFVIIDKDMTIYYGLRGWSEEIITQKIEELLYTLE
jgi:thiol-disulfide isomerase/thioredoxin